MLQRISCPNDSEALDRLFHAIELKAPMLAEIKAVVSEFYAVDPAEIEGRSRHPDIVRPRQVFCFFSYRYTRFSMRVVASRCGLTDVGAVRHAVRKIGKLALLKPTLADDLDLMRLRITEKVLYRSMSMMELARC
jgi:chromosomal replication initiation ATPase DnaA